MTSPLNTNPSNVQVSQSSIAAPVTNDISFGNTLPEVRPEQAHLYMTTTGKIEVMVGALAEEAKWIRANPMILILGVNQRLEYFWKLPETPEPNKVIGLLLNPVRMTNPYLYVYHNDKWLRFINQEYPVVLYTDIDIFYDADKELGKFPMNYSVEEGTEAIYRYIDHKSSTEFPVRPGHVFKLDQYSTYWMLQGNTNPEEDVDSHTEGIVLVDVTALMLSIESTRQPILKQL
jgi:hypothetical protein